MRLLAEADYLLTNMRLPLTNRQIVVWTLRINYAFFAKRKSWVTIKWLKCGSALWSMTSSYSILIQFLFWSMEVPSTSNLKQQKDGRVCNFYQKNSFPRKYVCHFPKNITVILIFKSHFNKITYIINLKYNLSF